MSARILVAEDEPLILESLTFLFTQEGYDLTAVENGTAALEAVSEEMPDLLVLDAMLPGMDGFSVLSSLRAGPAPDLPVLVLTAKGQEADRKRMMDLGADAFVSKPFSNRDLLDQVAGLLQARGPADGE
ncbi:MAG: response regulator transcription factor [Pseudomonadota bacterium]